jgi:hypothetical protein
MMTADSMKQAARRLKKKKMERKKKKIISFTFSHPQQHRTALTVLYFFLANN